MSRRDDQQLDKRFDDLVYQMRPYALRLKSPDSRLCRLWIDRLNRAEEQRHLRNDYLFELYKQLKRGLLRPPFHKPPDPHAKLMPLSKLQRLVLSSSCNELAETASPCESQQKHRLSWPKQRSKSLARKADTGSRRSFIPKRCDSSSPGRSARDFICEKDDNRNLLRTYKERIETLSTIVEELEAQNEKLKQKLVHYQNNNSSNASADEVAKMNAYVNQLTAEIETLRGELSKVNEIKENLSSKHNEIVERYKAQMREQVDSMKQKLENAQGENNELHEKIATIELKLQELTREKEITRSNDTEWKDKIENMKERYETSLQEKEEEIRMRDELMKRKDQDLRLKLDEIEALSAKLSELQQTLDSKSQEDCKLQSILMDQYSVIKKELAKMRDNIESASQKQNENYNQDISMLMKNMEKLKKFTRKLRDEYNKKIYHIKKENEKVINDLQTRLKVKCNAASPLFLVDSRYCEAEADPPEFDRNYKKFLDSLNKSVDDRRSKYYEKLSFLDNQLGCHLHRN